MTERILKRIRKWSEVEEDEEPEELDLDGMTKSLFDDLKKMYNTRHGTVLLDGDYGLPDYTSFMNTMSPVEIEKLTRAFIMTTSKYETRLKNVTVRYNKEAAGSGIMNFIIVGKLAFKDEIYPLTFNALLYGDGSVTLKL